MYYLVDTNIIISYMNIENPVLQEYINNSSKLFLLYRDSPERSLSYR